VRANAGSAARYLLVGAINTLLYSGILYILLGQFVRNSGFAVTLAYAIAVPFHFLLNRFYVFKATEQRMSGQVVRYATFMAMSYVVSLVVVAFCEGALNLTPFATVIANAFATTALGYVLSAIWVFR